MDVQIKLPRRAPGHPEEGKPGAQWQFMQAADPYVALISGYGLGKTTILCWKLIDLGQRNWGSQGLVVAHNYDQLVGNVIPKYKAALEQCGLPYSERVSEHKIVAPWGPVLFRTAEKAIVGFDCGYAGVDEACKCKDEVFKDVLARVRDKRAKHPQIIFTSTPEGRSGWIYKNFVKTPLKGSRIIYGSTRENAKNLVEGYEEGLLAAYDTKLQQAYLHGAFVDFNGNAAYHDFHEQLTVTASWPVQLAYGNFELMNVIPQEELIATFDFGNGESGVSSCVIMQRSMVNRQQRVRIIDEIWLKDSNTWECADELVKRYGGKGYRLRVHGDATGKDARGSTAKESDYQAIRMTCTGKFASVITDIPTSNSDVVDRINVVNSCLKGTPTFQLRIHPRCKRLIDDLNEVRYKDDGSRKLEKRKNKTLTHISDALGYGLQRMENPLEGIRQIRVWT